MSKENINKITKENYKINEIEAKDLKNEDKGTFDDNSFNQLLSLQLLIQKHSGLKELCKNNNCLINILILFI